MRAAVSRIDATTRARTGVEVDVLLERQGPSRLGDATAGLEADTTVNP
ncbi:hypothetical protein [Curtobacterium sp. VKM Ac-1376]|nr:hypothetical protein [Curtobacterium sp. VKM Ac-1376]MBF4614435.1 hypothetical protein [Curtobacterium sp. VKM Ac-1376]